MRALMGAQASALTDRPVFWLLVALAWFATMGWRPLLEPDEGRYAEVPREMWVSGDWVTPRLNGVKYFEKPVLQYWATAAMYSLFGVREWTGRFWSCALAFLCIPMTYVFARWLYGSKDTAVAAAAALAINPFFLIIGQLNLLDSALTFFLSAALFAYLRAGGAPDGSAQERRWMLVASLALGLAVLTKGIVALVLAGATLVIHTVLTREVRALRRWHLLLTLPLFLLVTVPWFVVVSLRNPEFPGFFFIHEHFERFLTNEAQRTGPVWYFVPCALLAVLPWIAHVWPALRRATVGGPRHPGKSAVWFLLIWCAVVFAFFSVSHSKLPPYIMPLMPALAVVLAPRIAERPAALRHAMWITSGLIVLVAGALLVAARRKAEVPTEMLMWSSVAAIVVVAVLLSRARAWAVVAVGAILGFQALMMSYSALPPVRTSKQLVAEIQPLVGPHTELFSVDQYRQSVPPYLGRTLRVVRYRGELDFGFRQDGSNYIPTLDAFIAEWSSARDALAFVAPDRIDELRARGVPFHVRAADGRSVVVSRR
ncbi:MAG TPA: glycosyltransferase family 39 protein [Steroidobacteraceae bacterium]|nr:glycosyltransferase family 39 protein [Steroidobacteraceae bacterium]